MTAADQALAELRAEWRAATVEDRAEIEQTARAIKILAAGGLL